MNEDMRNYFIAHQYELPRRLYTYAENYPNVSFTQALKLYRLAVEEVIVLFKAKHLYDSNSLLNFGRGIMYAQNEWLKKMQHAEELSKKGLKLWE